MGKGTGISFPGVSGPGCLTMATNMCQTASMNIQHAPAEPCVRFVPHVQLVHNAQLAPLAVSAQHALHDGGGGEGRGVFNLSQLGPEPILY